LFHEIAVRIERFDAPSNRYCVVLQPENGLLIKQDEMVIRRADCLLRPRLPGTACRRNPTSAVRGGSGTGDAGLCPVT
jgi:hypothetical protein